MMGRASSPRGSGSETRRRGRFPARERGQREPMTITNEIPQPPAPDQPLPGPVETPPDVPVPDPKGPETPEEPIEPEPQQI